MPRARTWDDVEKAIAKAVEDGILQDKRAAMPRGVHKGKQVEWSTIKVDDVLGCVVHQNGSPNTKDPIATARYHTSNGNHIGENGRPLASTCYSVMIPDLPGPAWLTGELFWRTWAQGAGEADHPGDENRHLKAILVMGGFEGPGFKRSYTKLGPTKEQVEKLVLVVKWMMETFGFGGEGVFGHYHFGKSSCPGWALMRWVEESREKDDQPELYDDRAWQEALLRWNAGCLPKFGADGDWGGESQRALTSFQRGHNIRVTGQQDPFTQLILLQRYPAPELVKVLDVKGDPEITFDISDATGDAESDRSPEPTSEPTADEKPAGEPPAEPKRAPRRRRPTKKK